MTNLFDTRRFPASAFGDLYHKRWRIEEAFKRLNLEHVSGLSQQTALREVDRVNHAYAHTTLKPLMPALLHGKKVARRLREVLNLIAKQTYLHRENLSKPRKPKSKSYKHMAQKPC